MVNFGLVCEGVRDQAVIKQILYGFYGYGIRVNGEHPQESAPPGERVGGWTVLKLWMQQDQHRALLRTNDYLVVHIDTDVCDHPGFDVPRSDDPDALRQAVINRLGEWMGADFVSLYGDRILYAIAIDGIECWLLPLLEERKAKQSKTAGCLATANYALKKAGKSSLKNSPDGPVRPYQDAAAPYRKRKTLLKLGPRNPSLAAFLAELDARGIEIPEDDED